MLFLGHICNELQKKENSIPSAKFWESKTKHWKASPYEQTLSKAEYNWNIMTDVGTAVGGIKVAAATIFNCIYDPMNLFWEFIIYY